MKFNVSNSITDRLTDQVSYWVDVLWTEVSSQELLAFNLSHSSPENFIPLQTGNYKIYILEVYDVILNVDLINRTYKPSLIGFIYRERKIRII